MSIYSDYKHGALTQEEFRSACAEINRKEAWNIEHGYDEEDEDEE